VEVRQVVTAINLTPVQHKRNKEFLTSVSNIRGEGRGSWSGLPESHSTVQGKTKHTPT